MPNMMLMGFFWTVFFILLIPIVIVSFDKFFNKGKSTNEDPIQIAKVRFAKGEISKEEYDQLINCLN